METLKQRLEDDSPKRKLQTLISLALHDAADDYDITKTDSCEDYSTRITMDGKTYRIIIDEE